MMRINLIVCLVAVLMASGAARAESAFLSGVYGQADVERACRDTGGTPIGAAGVSYGCKKENCDGKGGTCSVECTDPHHCLGTTPAQIVGPSTLLGLLQNGKRVLRAPGTGGGSLKSGTPAPDGKTTGDDTTSTDGSLY